MMDTCMNPEAYGQIHGNPEPIRVSVHRKKNPRSDITLRIQCLYTLAPKPYLIKDTTSICLKM